MVFFLFDKYSPLTLGEIKNPHNFYIQMHSSYDELCSLNIDLDKENEAKSREELVDTSLPPPKVSCYFMSILIMYNC